MRIMVTNDDGIEAAGLRSLALALTASHHSFQVVAPSTDFSGSGSGLGSIEHGIEIAYSEHSIAGIDAEAFAVDAPPTFAVLAACAGLFGPRPDLIVSGVNDGFNTGRFLSTSSTVSAALAAGSLGARGLAVSTGFAPNGRTDTASQVAVHAVDWMLTHSAPRTVLNVNVPDLGLHELKGVRTGPLAPRGLMGLRLTRSSDAIILERFENGDSLGTDTDAALVRDGYVALSVLPSISETSMVSTSADPAEPIEDALRTVAPSAS
ncbi:5'/3'-nucleotidase SurE [Gordonia sp. (in: high G+C Gram-positive bacteria)]|uniref:5'/3'-nucleotidase SurE n=1 Tax=Gordonia sp. (in: high G+C Gram-positive bacteria) TaxID=84139 RepID=UPI003F9BA5A5